MAKCYLESKYTTKKVTEVDYVCHKICENRANSLKRDLPWKFWELPEWKNYFIYQKKFAANLINEYGFSCVMSVLNKNPSIFSLRNPLLIDKLTEEYENLQRPASSINIVGSIDSTSINKTDKTKQKLDG
jgi:hypothetical protein